MCCCSVWVNMKCLTPFGINFSYHISSKPTRKNEQSLQLVMEILYTLITRHKIPETNYFCPDLT